MRHIDDLRAQQDIQAVSFFPAGSRGLGDHAAMSDIVARLRPAAIIHLAAVAEPAEASREPCHAIDINVTGTLMLAEAILKHSPSTRLVYASSSEVYGRSFNATTRPLDETAPLEPSTFYGVTKAAADLLLRQMAGRGLDVVSFRPFNHTGPGQAANYVVPAFARQVAQIERGLQPAKILVGNLDAERDFLDVRDVARAYALAALQRDPLPAGVAINLASGTARRIETILQAIIALSHHTIGIERDPARLRRSETTRAVGDPSRAKALLGWAPQIDFKTTLLDVLDYWRSQVAAGLAGERSA